MKMKIDFMLFTIIIMAVVITIITISIILANAAYSFASKENINNTAPGKININKKEAVNSTSPTINIDEKNTDVDTFLLMIITQRVLEDTIKTNEKISFMAIYSSDGTIIAHFKPERIGRNIYDADIEFRDYMQEIFYAMNNRVTYKGNKYDPLLNVSMKFIVKPLQISNFEEKLTLLIGMNEPNLIKEIKAVKTYTP